jgi:hypothetical protein
MWSVKGLKPKMCILVAFYLLIMIYNTALFFVVDTEIFEFMIVV